eukprot:gb/GFBE01049769.1/.p1 GENE.gb/GFBE01049769.1/~~gb/GFBE01049769.1/.p1  ORF type:complete len:580 (+),score=134.74 gb/GFBE01049769.1/:1-1740(+)
MGCGASSAKYAETGMKGEIDCSVQSELPEEGFGPAEKIGGLKRGSVILRRSVSAKLTDYYNLDGDMTASTNGVSFKRLVSSTTQESRATRCIRKHTRTQEEIDTEIGILRQMDNTGISKLYEVFEDSACWYLVTEFCSLGRLSDAIATERFSEQHAANVMYQVLRTITYMHSMKVCHRDLRPEVIMLQDIGNGRDDCSIRFVDLSSACHMKRAGKTMHGKVGSIQFSAPQMVVDDGYTELCDSWACGAVMHALLCGGAPFGGGLTRCDEEMDDLRTDILQRAQNGMWPKDEWRKLSKHAVKLMKALLVYEESERWMPQRCIGESWFHHHGLESKDAGLTVRQLENMKDFSVMNPLQKATLHIIAQRLPERETRDMRAIFDSMDFDQNGIVSYKELKMALQEFKSTSWRSQIAMAVNPKELMNLLDTNGSMELDFTEFISATLSKKYYHDEGMLQAAFQALDSDGSGEISLQELQQSLLDDEEDESEGARRIKQILSDADVDGNGQIDFQEFVSMMQATTKHKTVHRPESMFVAVDTQPWNWEGAASRASSRASSRAGSKASTGHERQVSHVSSGSTRSR